MYTSGKKLIDEEVDHEKINIRISKIESNCLESEFQKEESKTNNNDL